MTDSVSAVASLSTCQILHIVYTLPTVGDKKALCSITTHWRLADRFHIRNDDERLRGVYAYKTSHLKPTTVTNDVALLLYDIVI